jgi:hypothetical protein
MGDGKVQHIRTSLLTGEIMTVKTPYGKVELAALDDFLVISTPKGAITMRRSDVIVVYSMKNDKKETAPFQIVRDGVVIQPNKSTHDQPRLLPDKTGGVQENWLDKRLSAGEAMADQTVVSVTRRVYLGVLT